MKYSNIMEINIVNMKRYSVYLLSLFIISLGASLSIKANLGTSPLICIPYVSSVISNLSVGTTSFVFNLVLVFVQIILLRGDFNKRQYLQIVIGTIFSFFIDLTLMLIRFINPADYLSQLALLLISCVVMAIGVLLEIKTAVVYLPGDGFIVAIALAFEKEFGKIKPYIDTSFVLVAILLSFMFLGYLSGVREGTVISALIIGPMVRILKVHLNYYLDKFLETN